jgi:hypothetical protein
MFKLKKEDAIMLMIDIIKDEAFIRKEKPYMSNVLRDRYGLTERQQANVEVRLEKIFSYLTR